MWTSRRKIIYDNVYDMSMTPLNDEILLCTCVDMVFEKEILFLSISYLILIPDSQAHTRLQLCVVVNSFGLFSVQGLTHFVLDLCVLVFVPFSATAGHCGEQNVMLCL